MWSSGIANAFGFTGDGDHAVLGRPKTSDEIRDLIRQTSLDNPLWGAPRVHGELLKLGIEVNQATVGRYASVPEGSLPDLAQLFAEPYDSHRRGRHVRRRDRDV